jgi:low affinity Fe/Cu permease
MARKHNSDVFRRFAHAAAALMGSSRAFLLSLLIVVVWAVTGPLFHFSNAWQLVINTGTTIVTFLMVFLIQNTQNRDALAIHLKLDELLKVQRKARNDLVGVEHDSDERLQQLDQEFHALRVRVDSHLKGTKTGAQGATDVLASARDAVKRE